LRYNETPDDDDDDRRRRDTTATGPTVNVDAHDAHDDAVAAVIRRMETNRVWSRGAIPTAKAVPVTDCSHVQRRSSGDERGARADRESDGEWEVTGVVMRRVGVVGSKVDERRG
jgi:hypothetical protein